MKKGSILLAAGGLACCVSGPVHAWGDDGHQIVGLIAQHYLTPAVATQVNSMLAADTTGLVSPQDIRNEATWADRYRDSDRPSGPRYLTTRNWHFVDIELANGDLDAACFNHPALPAGTVASNGTANDCVTDKIDQFRQELSSASTSVAEKRLALQFLLHFLGDEHQPLHAADDNDSGGNSKSVHSTTLGSGNLHGFWDTQFVHQIGTDDVAVANALISAITTAQISQWQQGTPESWAQEAFSLAETQAYGRLPAPDSSGVYQLNSTYVTNATSVVRTQLSRAGVRLAYVLNQALASSGGGTTPPSQLLGNAGFENGAGSPTPWTVSSGVINSSAAEPPRTGSWDAWLDGYGRATTNTLQQSVAIPASAAGATLSFWLHIDTGEPSTTRVFDTLSVQILNSAGTVLATLASYSNLNAAAGYQQRSFDLTNYRGQTVTLRFTAVEDAQLQTSFVVDDTSLTLR